MCIDAKSARCCKIIAQRHSYTLPARLYFLTESFINTLCSLSERNLPTLIENTENHQIKLQKGRIGFSSFDVVDRDEP